MNHNNKIPYFKVNKTLRMWLLRDGDEGCMIVREAVLSMEKPPPPLPEKLPATAITSKPTPAAPKPKSGTGSVLLDVLLLYARFHEWLNTTEPPKALKPAATEKPEQVETIPPFDIQEIPAAMRKLKMPISAKLMEKWFAGKLNYSPRDADERAEINQDGVRYPSDMYDTTTITLDWVLRFSRARKQFDRLTKDAIRSPAARKILAEKLKAYANKVVDFSTAEICGTISLPSTRNSISNTYQLMENSLKN